LSADTIYRRYFGVRPHLSPADVVRFTHVDGRARFALVAVRDGDLMGVARYEGARKGTDAEIAVVVDDTLQHRGVGRLLLGRLVDIARENGFTTLTAEVLTGNRAMLGLMRALRLPQRIVRDVEVTTVVTDLTALDLPDDRRERARRHITRAGTPAVRVTRKYAIPGAGGQAAGTRSGRRCLRHRYRGHRPFSAASRCSATRAWSSSPPSDGGRRD
jgi:GNAT superfamily N-acetyltransferase